MSEITLVLADDHAVVRSGLRMLLDAQSDMRIVGEAKVQQRIACYVSALVLDFSIVSNINAVVVVAIFLTGDW